MKRIILLLFWGVFAVNVEAQTDGPTNSDQHVSKLCGFNEVLLRYNITHVRDLGTVNQHNANDKNAFLKGAGVVYDIPVVFHVVYNTPSFNLPDSIIKDQVNVLNKAYRKRHSDTANVRPEFKALSGDAEIQFHLATIDPQGNPTSGITRTVTSIPHFGKNGSLNLDSADRVKRTAKGGKDPWPTDRYLNIWVANLSDSTGTVEFEGYAIPPLNPVPANWPVGTDSGSLRVKGLIDGVVLQTQIVGSNNPASHAASRGTSVRGRTAVHEVGHYLGLMHIFGLNSGLSGSRCGTIADDGINDTPEQRESSIIGIMFRSCPWPTKNTCGPGDASDMPDMWENYMDYAPDACQTMFTHGQIAVMRNVLANQRNSLFQGTNTVHHLAGKKSLGIYPNPASNTLSVMYDGKIDRMMIINFMGQQSLMIQDTDIKAKSVDITTLPAGNYMLVVDTDGQRITNKFSVLR